jgi:membrane protein YdbS with pleckstrin-like domain
VHVTPQATPAGLRHPDPATRLSRSARSVWIVEALVWAVPLLVVAVVGAAALRENGGATVLPIAIVAVALLIAVAGVGVWPQLRWSRWRYDVRDEEVDLRHGAATVVRTMVPMARIQHVETRRTVVSQLFSTATLVLHTAGGAARIPALDDPVAEALRDRIAELARTPDDDDLTA